VKQKRTEAAVDIDRVTRDWETLAREDPLWAVYVAPGVKGGKWDVAAFADSGRAEVERVLARLDGLLPALPRGEALDFGCGVGRLTAALCEHFDAVTGVDASETMIEHARRLDLSAGGATYVHNTGPDLRLFPSRSFDLVYTSLVLQHLPRDAALAYLREMLRVTKPSGCVVAQVTSEPDWSAKGMVFRFAPPRLIGWAQRRLLGYPAPMLMTALPDDLVRATVAGAGGSVLAAEADDSYGGHWRYTRYFLRPGDQATGQ
jgi:SAM-dependent methyltransferase